MLHRTIATGAAVMILWTAVSAHTPSGYHQPHTHHDAYHALEQSRRGPVTMVTVAGSGWQGSRPT
jgi:hypothetical protein